MNYDAPQWLFWILLGAGLYIAAFRTYNDVKRKLDDIGEEFFFEHTGISVTTKTGDVLINATFRAKPSVIVDELYLEIKGIRFPPSKWTPFSVSPQYTNTWTFKLGETNKDETHIGKLIAKIGKKEHESREFDVYA